MKERVVEYYMLASYCHANITNSVPETIKFVNDAANNENYGAYADSAFSAFG